MTATLHHPKPLEALEALTGVQVPQPTDADVLTYLRRSFRMRKAVVLAERDAMIAKFAEQLGVTISDEELQTAADTFRRKYKLMTNAETQSWLAGQQMTAEDWSEGLKQRLIEKKLEEYLFGAIFDNNYASNRDIYKRAAFSQILVSDEAEAQQLAQTIRAENASFGTLAITHSVGAVSKANAGYVGVRFYGELHLEIAQAIATAKEGEIVGPIQTKLGYHIVRIEKQFSAELPVAQRKRMLAAMLKLAAANINIIPVFEGGELLADSESYMGELTDDELGAVAGGASPTIVKVPAVVKLTGGLLGGLGAGQVVGDLFEGD